MTIYSQALPYRRHLAAACLAGSALLGVASSALADNEGLDEPFRAAYKTALQGKTVAFLPGAMAMASSLALVDCLAVSASRSVLLMAASALLMRMP